MTATRPVPLRPAALILGGARLHRDRYLMGANLRPAAFRPSRGSSLGWKLAGPGWHTFQVCNAAAEGAEADLVNPASGAIYAEVEALGPGTTSPMRLNVGSGSYAFRCLLEDADAITGPTVTVGGHARGERPRPVTPVAAVTVCRGSRLVRRGPSGLGGPPGTFLGTVWATESRKLAPPGRG